MLSKNSPFNFGGQCVCQAVALATSALPLTRSHNLETATWPNSGGIFSLKDDKSHLLINDKCLKCDHFLETWR